MALSKEDKKQIVDEVSQLVSNSKLTAFAHYPGTTVKDMQQLRQRASEDGTAIRVVKNRLFKRALQGSDLAKLSEDLELSGQMLYAFNKQDEVAPARQLVSFSKDISPLELVGGFTSDGQILAAEDIQALASLPTKDELRGRLVGTLASPLSSFTGVMAANVRSVLNVFEARSASLNN